MGRTSPAIMYTGSADKRHATGTATLAATHGSAREQTDLVPSLGERPGHCPPDATTGSCHDHDSAHDHVPCRTSQPANKPFWKVSAQQGRAGR